MGLVVYNTLTRKKEEFVPIEENRVKIYMCGPTVYNYIHIGNSRPIIVFDTVRKYLEYKGFSVEFVQNFTDIDDKIINEGNKINKSYEFISKKYIKEFLLDSDNLNVKRANNYPKVTEEIDEIIAMIEDLKEKGYTYQVDGTVYFRTKKFKNYGKLSNRKIEDMLPGARVEINKDKEGVADFVLWKKSKENEPSWSSPFGNGRPGWHIECSAMCKKYLGETVDIHCGGADLSFPHHENEIAQSEATTNKTLSNYWLHNGFININNEKMSKSTGNFFILREVADKFGYNVVRFFILSTHYRSPLNFDKELLESSKKGLNRITNLLRNLEFKKKKSKTGDLDRVMVKELEKFKKAFIEEMDDDFNTANAISVIFNIVKFLNVNIKDNTSSETIDKSIELVRMLLEILGIEVEDKKEKRGLNENIENLIIKRTEAKKNKDFKKADTIRKELENMGIVIEDTRSGVKWSFINE